MLSVYVAGFDVFAPDCEERRIRAQKAVEARGFACLHPFDNEATTARDIYEGNVNMIANCDVVVANLNPFRGPCEPDAGTAFEVGYAKALGKQVWGYLDDDVPMNKQMGPCDERGYRVEDFDLPMNLMLAKSVHLVRGTFENCLDALADQVKNRRIIRF